jgi:2-polyprenyl-3-methyl-5-hydroxy-6-metoxy-1,4-benzoquinol methylase
MPVNEKQTAGQALLQRSQYSKGGIGRLYWDYRDRVALSFLGDSDRHIVDLGCGEGITLEKMTRQMPQRRLLGLDCMQENIDICLAHGLPARLGNIYDLDLPDESVDAAMLMEVIEHLEQPDTALREIHRILKPGGKVILVYPNDRAFKIARMITMRFEEASYDPGHVKQWTHPEIEGLLNLHGYRVMQRRFIPFFIWAVSLHGVVAAIKQG